MAAVSYMVLREKEAHLNLRDLRYLVAVADERHFGRASEKCHVSQPTLSAQIRKLEDYLGLPVFERGKKSVSVTPAGAAIIERARKALAEADAIFDIADENKNGLAGPFRLGAIPTICPYLMPEILPVFSREHPDLHLIVSEDITDHLTAKLAGGDVDAIVLATDPTTTDVAEIDLFDEPFMAVLPSAHPLAAKESLTQEDLLSADMLLLTEGHCFRDQALDVCARSTDEVDDANDVRATSLETLLHLVAAGHGSTLIPRMAMRSPWTEDDRLAFRPVSSHDAHRKLRLVVRKSFPRMQAAQAVADILRRTQR